MQKKNHAVQLAQQLTTLRKALAPIEPFYQRTTLNRLLCKHFISSVDPWNQTIQNMHTFWSPENPKFELWQSRPSYNGKVPTLNLAVTSPENQDYGKIACFMLFFQRNIYQDQSLLINAWSFRLRNNKHRRTSEISLGFPGVGEGKEVVADEVQNLLAACSFLT